MAKKRTTIVLGVCGSIAAYKAADLVRRLQDAGCDVEVLMTLAAEEFITPLTLAALSGNKVHRRMFDQDQDDWNKEHIALAQAADVFLIAPATADVIGKLAAGIADDLLTCTALATRAPIVIAPAMNDKMFTHPIVQENCQKLKKLGVVFVSPVQGRLACGAQGQGHLAPTEDIVKQVQGLLG